MCIRVIREIRGKSFRCQFFHQLPIETSTWPAAVKLPRAGSILGDAGKAHCALDRARCDAITSVQISVTLRVTDQPG